MKKHGFIYVWFDKKRKMYYVGSHWGGSKDDGYICSSNRMRDAYRRRPEDFKRRVVQNQFGTRKELLLLEERWLQLAKKKPKQHYNLKFETAKTEYTRKGKKHSEEFKKQRSLLMYEKFQNQDYKLMMTRHLKGRIFSSETKLKMSLSKIGITRPVEIGKKISKSKLGIKRPPEVCAKISAGRKGKKFGPRGPYKTKKLNINILPK